MRRRWCHRPGAPCPGGRLKQMHFVEVGMQAAEMQRQALDVASKLCAQRVASLLTSALVHQRGVICWHLQHATLCCAASYLFEFFAHLRCWWCNLVGVLQLARARIEPESWQ